MTFLTFLIAFQNLAIACPLCLSRPKESGQKPFFELSEDQQDFLAVESEQKDPLNKLNQDN